MDDDEFSDVMKKTKSLVCRVDQDEIVKKLLAGYTMHASQVAQPVDDVFTYVQDRVNYTAMLFNAVCDKQNWYLVYDKTRPADREALRTYQNDIKRK